MSTLVTNTKNIERMKIVESDLLGDLKHIKVKSYKSDLSEDNKKIMIETLETVENIVQDLFASEYYRAKKIGFV